MMRGASFGVTAASLVLAVLLAGSAGCARKTAESSTQDASAVLVSASEVVKAEARDLESGISFTGELLPAEIVEVVARFDGDLEKVFVREGQAVQLGQSLATYAPRDVKDAWQAADAGYQAAQASMIAAENAERRAKRLLDAGAASPSDLEAAKAQRAAAEAGLRAAEAYRNRASEDQERLDVPSPITGSMAKVLVHSGDRDTAQLVSVAILELRIKLNQIDDSELKALCDAVLRDVEATERPPHPRQHEAPRGRSPVSLKLVK